MRESKVEENLENDETEPEHGNFAFRLQLDLRHPRPVIVHSIFFIHPIG